MAKPADRREPSLGVTGEAIQKIRTMIVDGSLQPGDRLPPENELAALLGLSRSSLRESVRALELMHILDVRQGEGTFVTSLRPDVLLAATSFVIDIHRDDSVLQFLEVRRVLEPAAVAMAARGISDEQIATLRSILNAVSIDAEPDLIEHNDQEFHRAIVSYCRNSVLAALLESMSGPIHRARSWGGLTQPADNGRSRAEHLGILDALERREPELASARAGVHIAGLEDRIRQVR